MVIGSLGEQARKFSQFVKAHFESPFRKRVHIVIHRLIPRICGQKAIHGLTGIG